MPELPEVETVVRSLRPHLAGRRLGPVLARDRRAVRTPPDRLDAIAGATVERIGRVGKFVRIQLDTGQVLTVHLGMSGRMVIVPADRPLANHTYLRIELGGQRGQRGRAAGGRRELRFVNPRWCMGGVWLLDRAGGAGSTGSPGDPAGDLGTDPLAIPADDFVALLGRHGRRGIKALLLDQRILAGMGNIYCDEALFAAAIHPRAIAGRLSPARRRRLWRAIRDRLNRAIARGGSTLRDYRNADGQPGWFQISLRAYGRTGQPCRRCGRAGRIRHAVVAGRSTHFCPHCQKMGSSN